MRKLIFRAIVISMLVPLAACDKLEQFQKVAQLNTEMSQLRADVAQLKSTADNAQKQQTPDALSRISSLEGQVAGIDKRLETTDWKVWFSEFREKAAHTVTIDPTGEKSYQKLEASNGTFGTFLVSLENVVPYLDGQKVTLSIGNPHYATFAGIKLKVGWSKKVPDGNDPVKYKEYTDSMHEKEVDLTDRLKPGAWNKVTFTVAPAAAKDFGQLEVGIVTNQVVLNN